VLFLGAFPTDAPNESQASALKHASENPLTAVIGPPGNGKTTLLLFIPAQQVVKRAYQLASTGVDASNLTLVTSTNNRAVANVIEKLTAELGNDRFYLEGGRAELIDRQVIPKLQAAIDWLETETFNEAEGRQASQQLLALANELHSQPQLDQEKARQRERDLQDLGRLEREIQSLTDQIEARPHQPIKAQSPDYTHYPLEAYERILPQLERAIRSLPPVELEQLLKRASNWWERLWYSLKKLWQHLTRTSTRHILMRLHQEIHAPLTATLATPFPFQLPLTRESLQAAHSQVASQLAAAHQWRSQSPTESPFSRQLKALRKQLDTLRGKKALIKQRLVPHPTEEFYTRFPREYHPQQQELFKLSWQYLYHFRF
jgi:transposase